MGHNLSRLPLAPDRNGQFAKRDRRAPCEPATDVDYDGLSAVEILSSGNSSVPSLETTSSASEATSEASEVGLASGEQFVDMEAPLQQQQQQPPRVRRVARRAKTSVVQLLRDVEAHRCRPQPLSSHQRHRLIHNTAERIAALDRSAPGVQEAIERLVDLASGARPRDNQDMSREQVHSLMHQARHALVELEALVCTSYARDGVTNPNPDMLRRMSSAPRGRPALGIGRRGSSTSYSTFEPTDPVDEYEGHRGDAASTAPEDDLNAWRFI